MVGAEGGEQICGCEGVRRKPDWPDHVDRSHERGLVPKLDAYPLGASVTVRVRFAKSAQDQAVWAAQVFLAPLKKNPAFVSSLRISFKESVSLRSFFLRDDLANIDEMHLASFACVGRIDNDLAAVWTETGMRVNSSFALILWW